MLTDAGIDLVSLANNHVLDFGVDSLRDTFRYLSGNNILYAGAGENDESAYKPVYISKNGVTVAFIASSRVIPRVGWAAKSNQPGVSVTYDPERVIEEIRKANDNADIIAVYAHWGEERNARPVDCQLDLAHAYIDAGADIIVGSHPHILQGFEFYKGRLIAYSLGNFIFSDVRNDTMILNIRAAKNQIHGIQVTPCEINNFRPVILKEEVRAKALFDKLEMMSVNAVIDKNGIITEKK